MTPATELHPPSSVFACEDGLRGPSATPGAAGARVRVGFTDSRLDVAEGAPGMDAALTAVEAACGVPVVRMRQVHGADVALVTSAGDEPPVADALVTTRPGLALMTRAADCVPVLLADADVPVVAAAHAGRAGLVSGVLVATLDRLRELGAGRVRAWVGPHVCGACYEVPDRMRDEVAAAVPGTWATTSWQTPALDLGAGAVAQLEAGGASVTVVPGCTREDRAWWSHRRDGDAAGRMGAVVWIQP